MNKETKTDSLLDGDFSCETLDHILQICMMYEKSKYVVRKNKI